MESHGNRGWTSTETTRREIYGEVQKGTDRKWFASGITYANLTSVLWWVVKHTKVQCVRFAPTVKSAAQNSSIIFISLQCSPHTSFLSHFSIYLYKLVGRPLGFYICVRRVKRHCAHIATPLILFHRRKSCLIQFFFSSTNERWVNA